jgi:hypothetical protein
MRFVVLDANTVYEMGSLSYQRQIIWLILDKDDFPRSQRLRTESIPVFRELRRDQSQAFLPLTHDFKRRM